MAQFLTYVREGRNAHDAYMRVLAERSVRLGVGPGEVEQEDEEEDDMDVEGMDAEEGLDEGAAWEVDDAMEED